MRGYDVMSPSKIGPNGSDSMGRVETFSVRNRGASYKRREISVQNTGTHD